MAQLRDTTVLREGANMKIIDFTTATTARGRAERFARFQRHMRLVLQRISEEMAARRQSCGLIMQLAVDFH